MSDSATATETKGKRGRKKGVPIQSFPLNIAGVGNAAELSFKKQGFPGGPHVGPSEKYKPLIDACYALDPTTTDNTLVISLPEGQAIESLKTGIRSILNKWVKEKGKEVGKYYKIRTMEGGTQVGIVCTNVPPKSDESDEDEGSTT